MKSLLVLLLLCTLNSADAATDQLAELFPLPPDLEPGISLTAMLAKAGENNYSIQKALLAEDSAQAAKEQALASFLPGVSASLGYDATRQLIPESVATHKFNGTAQLWLPLIDVSSWANFKVSKGRYALQKSQTELLKQEVAYQLTIAYLQARSMASLLNLLRSEAEAIIEQKQIASWRIAAGIGSASEALRADVELVSLRKEYSAARLSYIKQCEVLGQLLGEDGPVVPLDEDIIFKEPESGDHPLQLELEIARQNMDLAEGGMKTQKLKWVPSLGSTWKMGLGVPIKPEQETTFSLGAAITLSIPIFDWGMVASIKSSRANFLSAKIDYAEEQNRIERESRLAQVNLQQIATEEALYIEQAELAAQSLTIDLGDYQNGSGSALQVIESRRSHQVAEVGALRQHYELDIAKLNYWQSLGYQVEQILK